MSIFEEIARGLRRVELNFRQIAGMPLVGEINDRFLAAPPKLGDNRFGKTTKIPTILEIFISRDHQWPLDVGQKVKNVYFLDYPPIVFNVCFCCARPSLFLGGDYANPHSHWFNVFFGFYEIDVPKSKWTRPFGFKSADGFEPEFEDLLRIAKSDWNYFSNNIYGVPDSACAACDDLSLLGIETKILQPRVMIGGRRFVECKMDGVKVVSAYVSGRDGARLKDNNGVLSPIWRTVFGRSKPQPDFSKSFIPTTMRMQSLMSFEEEYDEDLEEPAWKTLFAGGSINLQYKGPIDNEAFLNAQMQAVMESLNTQPFQKIKTSKKCASWKNKK